MPQLGHNYELPFFDSFIFCHILPPPRRRALLKDQAIQRLKEEGNKLFSLKKYHEAIEKSTKAAGLQLHGQNSILHANRVASCWVLQRFVDVVLLLPQLI